jgi:signal transduction histidine kinase
MRLEFVNHTLQLVVSDSGRGFSPGATGAQALGLVSMRERVDLVGGRLEVQSAPGAGARVSACIPLDQRGDSGQDGTSPQAA